MSSNRFACARAILLFGLILAEAPAFADTTRVSGTIVNQTWTPVGNPYCVTGDIFVAGLTIEPGVRVIFMSNYIFEVGGVLTAIGTQQDSIVFTKADTSAGWRGIFFNFSGVGCELAYCVIEKSTNRGIHIDHASPLIRNCLITGNSMSVSGVDAGLGGGLYGVGDITLDDCVITNNSSTVYLSASWYASLLGGGGGIYVNGTLALNRCTIRNNRANALLNSYVGVPVCMGGGVCVDGKAIVSNCIIDSNRAYARDDQFTYNIYSRGGGVYVQGTLFLLNSIISNNTIDASSGHPNSGLVRKGGGVYTSASDSLSIINSTLVSNSPEGIFNDNGVVSIKNSILFFNAANQIVGVDSAAYCDVQNGYGGTGNINQNPVFESMLVPQIVPGSPCVDAGDPDSIYNDVCFPPSLGTARNDIGAHGGPGACGQGSPAAPLLVSPSKGSINNETSVTLIWRPSVAAENYGLQVATDSVFRSVVIDRDFIVTTSDSIGPLQHVTKYYWRVNATNIAGTSNWSQVWDFTTIGIISIQVMVQTNPIGDTITVDGVRSQSPQIFTWLSASSHTIGTDSIQVKGEGTRHVWNRWSDGGARLHAVRPTKDTAFTAIFTVQYYLTMNAGTGGTVTPSSSWNDSGKAVTITATPSSGNSFDGWVGTGTGSYTGTNNPASVTMQGPITESARFIGNTIQVSVGTSPAGLSFRVDGADYTSAQTLSFVRGSSHTISIVTNLQSGGTGIQYLWSSWSDGGAISHTVSPTSDTTFTANFGAQYYLTMNAGAGGTVSPASNWQNSGDSVTIVATAEGGYTFSGWIGSGTGSYTGPNNPAVVTMKAPITETASFILNPVRVTIRTNPAGDSIAVDGVKFQSPQTLTWSSGTSHTIGTDNVQVVGVGTRHLWKSWSDGGTISHTVTPTSDTTFTANFTLQYYLTTSAGAGGTVTPSSNWLNSDSTVTITAIPSSGNSFDGWWGTGTGSYTGTNNPASVTMQGPITEAAAFVDRTPPEFAGLQNSMCEMSRVRLVWSAATDPSVPIKYYVYKATSSGGQDYNHPDTTTTDTTVVLATLTRFQTYYFVVRAEDAVGNWDTNRVERSWFAPPVGDFTCDNRVDGQDLAVFARAWREEDPAVGDIGPADSIPPYLKPRPDGRIDFEDLVVFGLMWNWSLDYSAALQSGSYATGDHVEREAEVSLVEPTVLSVGERKTYSLVLGGIKDIQTASIRFEYDGRRIRIDSLSVNADSRTIVLKRVDNGRGYALVDVAGLDGTMDTQLLTKGFVEVSVTALAPIQEEPITVVTHTYSSKAELTSETVKQIRFNSTSTILRAFSLLQNYPNPFNPSTTIGFSIPVSSHVTLTIVDLLGRQVETPIDENREAGEYKVQWNAANLSSGLYFYRLKAGGYTDTKKLILLR
jgi:hypothetical protein